MPLTFWRPIRFPPIMEINLGRYFGTVDAIWGFSSAMAVSLQFFSAIELTSNHLKLSAFQRSLLYASLVLPGAIFHNLMLMYLAFVYRFAPYACVGGVGKLLLELLTVAIAAALREFLGYDPLYLLFLIGFIINAYIFARYLHVAYDVSLLDILLDVFLVAFVYFTGGNLYTSLVIYMLCAGLILFRFLSYSPPAIPVVAKKESELLPC